MKRKFKLRGYGVVITNSIYPAGWLGFITSYGDENSLAGNITKKGAIQLVDDWIARQLASEGIESTWKYKRIPIYITNRVK